MRFDATTPILYADDDQLDIVCMERSFTKNGIDNPLHIAHDGLEALAMLRGKCRLDPPPPIVLLDINMPKLNGLETLSEIRKDPTIAHTQVFMVTTSDQRDDLVRAYALNVAGYLVKPPSLHELVVAIGLLRDVWCRNEYPPPAEQPN